MAKLRSTKVINLNDAYINLYQIIGY